ncbi:uncharacterized protein LOC135220307 [Macrobrachium nipponense]|uniref:uncharacterized protein LOC135220307 n=1 Tax=Macrobrachium nipponense TaxID=159736 RepID=UPI0030C85061
MLHNKEPKETTGTEKQPKSIIKLALNFPSLVSEHQLDDLQEEWRALIRAKETVHPMIAQEVTEIWHTLRNVLDGNGHRCVDPSLQALKKGKRGHGSLQAEPPLPSPNQDFALLPRPEGGNKHREGETGPGFLTLPYIMALLLDNLLENETRSRRSYGDFGKIPEFGVDFIKCIHEKKMIQEAKNTTEQLYCAQRLKPTDATVENWKSSDQNKHSNSGKRKRRVPGDGANVYPWKKQAPKNRESKKIKRNTYRKKNKSKRDGNGSSDEESSNNDDNGRTKKPNGNYSNSKTQQYAGKQGKNEKKRGKNSRKSAGQFRGNKTAASCGNSYAVDVGDKLTFTLPRKSVTCEIAFETTSRAALNVQCKRLSLRECSTEYLYLHDGNEEQLYCGKAGPQQLTKLQNAYFLYERLSEKTARSRIHCTIAGVKMNGGGGSGSGSGSSSTQATNCEISM